MNKITDMNVISALKINNLLFLYVYVIFCLCLFACNFICVFRGAAKCERSPSNFART